MSTFQQALAAGKFVITAELAPPKGVAPRKPLEAAEHLRKFVDAINVTDQQASVMRSSPVALCRVLKEHGFEPVMQITCRDRNRIALQADLLAAHILDIKNILCLTGDPVTMGDHPDAKPVFDIDVVALVQMATTLQQGKDLTGHELEGAPTFCIGVVVDPGADPVEQEVIKLERKVEAGAVFVQSQAVFYVREFERLRSMTKHIDAKLLAGVMLLKSGNMARWLNKNVPGIRVPGDIIQELDGAGDKAEKSVEIAARTIKALHGLCDGVHLMALGWERRIPSVLEAAGLVQRVP